MASEAPPWLAAALAIVSTATGAWLARREARRPAMQLVWMPGHGLSIDGQQVEKPRLSWRGPLAFLEWRDRTGRVRRVTWWPDTLGPAVRRELRLAAIAASPSRSAPSMAP